MAHLHVREDGDQARHEFETYHRHGLGIAREDNREKLPPIDYEALFNGPFVCGTPAEAVDKLLWLHERYGHDLHEFHVDVGGMPWNEVKATMEIFASEVSPAVHAALDGVAA